MTWIVALSIGPVAGFVAAGRRSRDLWYGSTWLSKTTVAVATHMIDSADWPAGVEVELLLPALQRLADLEKQSNGMHCGRVSNKILGRVTVSADVTDAQAALRSIATNARSAARSYLLDELANLVKPFQSASIRPLIDHEAFARQIDAIERGDFVEFSAAWAPLQPGEDPFGSVVKRACELRDTTPKLFSHPGFSRLGAARSDLDEGRDTVLRSTRNDGGELQVQRARAGIIESEELDAIGLLRRIAPGLPEMPFPSLSRVTADPWIEGCATRDSTKNELESLCADIAAAKKAQGEDFFVWCSPSRDPGEARPVTTFPFDASVVFEGGCEALLSSAERLRNTSRGAWTGADAVMTTLRAIQSRVRHLHRLADVPIPYFALIELDGDRIGSLLADQHARRRYEALVRALDVFADGAAELIGDKRGTAFYVAGDELSAYVPLDRALSLVATLAAAFTKALEAGGFPGRSLSAGVVFAHVKDDLRDVRSAARTALRRAKDVGSGHLCVREMPRAGSDREIVGPITVVLDHIQALVKCIREGQVSLRTEQHLRDHIERFSAVTTKTDAPPGVLLARDAVRRQLERAGRDDAQHPLSARVAALQSWDDVFRLADEIRIASRVHDVDAQRGSR